MSRIKEFWKCTNVKFDGVMWSIDCVIGLYGVTASSRVEAEKEAFHYFNQYREDGEYSSIIGGKTVVETQLENKGG